MLSRWISWKVLIPSLIALAAVLLAIRFARREVRVFMRARVVRAAPAAPISAFTLELGDVLREGSDRSVEGHEGLRLIIAQRSDGSRVDRTTHYPGTSMEFTMRMIRLSNGMNIVAWDSVNLKTTWKDSPVKADRFKAQRSYVRTAASGCATDSFGRPVAQRAQYVAKGVQLFPRLGNMQTFAFTKSNPVEEVLMAPQFDCEEVYRFTVFKRNDGGTDSSERTAKTYTIGEPAASLFDTAGLREVSPVTAFETQYRKIGWPEAQIEKHVAELKPNEDQYFRQ
jgi:hypothetical protein